MDNAAHRSTCYCNPAGNPPVIITTCPICDVLHILSLLHYHMEHIHKIPLKIANAKIETHHNLPSRKRPRYEPKKSQHEVIIKCDPPLKKKRTEVNKTPSSNYVNIPELTNTENIIDMRDNSSPLNRIKYYGSRFLKIMNNFFNW